MIFETGFRAEATADQKRRKQPAGALGLFIYKLKTKKDKTQIKMIKTACDDRLVHLDSQQRLYLQQFI